MQPLIVARIVVNFTSAVVPILVSNICLERFTIPKVKVLADDTALNARRVDLHELSTPPNCVASVSTSDVGSASCRSGRRSQEKRRQVTDYRERGLLERLLRKHTSVFAACPTDLVRTSLMYHRIDIGDYGLVRQQMRRVPHEHIPVLKAEV